MAAQKAQSLLRKWTNTRGFDQVLSKINVVSAGNGRLVAEMKVEEEHTNYFKTLHGGMTATIVDIISSVGRSSHPTRGTGNCVSVNINLSYLNPAKLGDTIVISTDTLKAGKNLAYLEVKITEKLSGKLIATGSQTEFLLD